jgi:DNA-binding response OmpR family regulator
MLAMLQDTLEMAKHEVVSAHDGRQATELYREKRPDLVITDVFMPAKDGFETIIDLRKEFPDSLIIAVTGRPANAHVLPVAKRLGAVEVLQKPFSPEELLEVVNRVLA